MSKNKHAVVLLDETGSMQGQEERVCTSMNDYAAALPKGCTLTVFKFNSSRFVKHYEGPAKKWEPMKLAEYKPVAMTPLYDSIAKTIKHAKKNTVKGDKVMIMIDTDGLENDSSDYKTAASIKELIEKQQAKGWEFLFVASALTERQAADIGTTGQTIGVNTVISGSYAMRGQTYAVAADATSDYLTAGDNE